MKKTKQAYPDKKVLALMIKYGITEESALKLGLVAVEMAQRLFLKWKTNFSAHRETLDLMYAKKTETKIEVTN